MIFTSIQRQILFPRHLVHTFPGAGVGVPGLERIWIESPEGPVEGWFLPGNGVSEKNPGPLVIFAHGNGELIDYWPEEMGMYREMGCCVLLPEYRGYGRSAGKPSQEAIGEDFLKFHDIMSSRGDVDKTRIVYHGRSLGGGAVCDLASKRQPRAMILQSTFTSVKDMARRFMLPGPLVADPFDNFSVLKTLDVPVLIMHGRRDDLIPYGHAEKNREAARNAVFIAYDCGHNDPPDPDVYWRDIHDFLNKNGIIRAC
jgi:fermentation-respiration switch protein FrsA (DUF1100 family)